MAQDQKQEAIIQAAIKRFAHFGVAKTTMAEIASDLAFSKASLYYYFPDKMNLFAAVLQYITDSGAKAGEEQFMKEKDPFKAIQVFLENRTDFIIKYHNIVEHLKTFNPSQIPAELQPVFAHLKKVELQRLIKIIEKGVQSGIFKNRDAKKTAELLFEFLEGFRLSLLLNNPSLFPDKKQFQHILRKELEFSRIYLNGLTIP